MQVFEVTTTEELGAMCDSGTELVSVLVKVLERRGLGPECAVTSLGVAVAGVLKASGVSGADFMQMVESLMPMWHAEMRDGAPGFSFDKSAIKAEDATAPNPSGN